MFNFLKKQFIDVIDWTESENGLLVYKYPMQDREIQNGARLTVTESQSALFINEGKIADLFPAGNFTLTTQTLPVLTNLKNWDKLFASPFKSDVFYFSMREQTQQKWGTQSAITVSDPQLGALRIKAFGQYNFKVVDPKAVFKKLSGTMEMYRVEDIDSFLRAGIMTQFATLLAQSEVPFLKMAANQTSFSEHIRNGLQPLFSDYGLQLTQFLIESISLPEEVQAYIDKSTSMNALGDLKKYTQFQAAEAIKDAAQNPSGMAGLGAQISAGVVLGQTMSQALGGGNSNQTSSSEDVFQKIEKLHALFQKGVLSQTEFEAKKADLLSKI